MLEYCAEGPLLALYKQVPSLLTAYVGHPNVPAVLLLQRAMRISRLLKLRNVLSLENYKRHETPPSLQPLDGSYVHRLEIEFGVAPKSPPWLLQYKLLNFLHEVHPELVDVRYSLRPNVGWRVKLSSGFTLYALFMEMATHARRYSSLTLQELTLDTQKLRVYCFPS